MKRGISRSVGADGVWDCMVVVWGRGRGGWWRKEWLWGGGAGRGRSGEGEGGLLQRGSVGGGRECGGRWQKGGIVDRRDGGLRIRSVRGVRGRMGGEGGGWLRERSRGERGGAGLSSREAGGVGCLSHCVWSVEEKGNESLNQFSVVISENNNNQPLEMCVNHTSPSSKTEPEILTLLG